MDDVTTETPVKETFLTAGTGQHTSTAGVTKQQRVQHRKDIASWVRRILRERRISRQSLEARWHKPLGWFANRLSHTPAVTFWRHELKELGVMIGQEVPEAILVLSDLAHAGRSAPSRAQHLKLDTDALASATTAAQEMAVLLDAACAARDTARRARDRSWVAHRFGIGGPAKTLETIGQANGVTRERVRQVEDRVLELASIVAAGRTLPMLSSIHTRVRESAGMPLAAVEQELERFLGGVPLMEALRFLETIQPPEKPVAVDHASIYGAGKWIRVVAETEAERRFASQVSTAARKLFHFAGAGLVHDVRALVEKHRKRPVMMTDLVRILSALPELVWLDASHRWFWFSTEELPPLLHRAAVIMTIAQTPVDMETLYAGLVREARRDVATIASECSDPIPPCHVVHEILRRHPDFRRTKANGFTYTKTLDLDQELEATKKLVLARMEEFGGIVTRPDLYALSEHPDRPIPRNSFAAYLYLWGFVEHDSSGLWRLRGRAIKDSDRQAAIHRLPDYARSRPQIKQEKTRREGESNVWQARFPITDAARRNLTIYLRASEMPCDVAGPYTAPDGHAVNVVQDAHGDRLTSLNNEMKRLLRDPGVAAILLSFDAAHRTITIEPEPFT